MEADMIDDDMDIEPQMKYKGRATFEYISMSLKHNTTIREVKMLACF